MGTVLTQRHRDTEVGDAARWPRVRLGDVCEFRRGLTYSKKDEVASSRNVVLRSNNIDLMTGKLDFSELKYVSESFAVPIEKIVTRGAVLMCMANGSKSHLGKVALIDEDYGYAFGGFMGLLVPSTDIVPSYLYWILSSYGFKRLIESLTDGANINNLKFADIADFEFPLPPLSVQREIVAWLERELGAVDKLAKKFEELEAAAEAEFNAELKETFEEIKRRGTETRRLGELCERITKGTTPTSVGFAFTATGVNFVKVESFSDDGDLVDTRVAHVSRECHEALKRSQLKEGDVLFSIAGALGRVAKVDVKILPANTNQALAIIRLSNATEIDVGYLMLALRGPSVSVQIDDMKKATAQANLSLQNVRDFQIPVPSLSIQRSVVARLDAAKGKKEKLVAAARRGRETAALMRKAILKEAFE